MNIAYKHLETRLRIAELTLGQWISIVLGACVAVLWALYVSPFGAFVTLFSAIYIGGVPIMAAWLASEAEFDLWLRVRALWQWRKRTDRYIPGDAPAPRGYVLTEPVVDVQTAPGSQLPELDLAALWD